MTSLAEFLFPAPARRSTGAIVRWWEGRRLAFNLFVGTAGTVTLLTIGTLAWITPWIGLPPELPWQPVVLFGVMANVCYTLGAVLEILAEKIWGRGLLPVGPVLYRMGLTFSVGLALFPALIFSVVWVVSMVVRLF